MWKTHMSRKGAKIKLTKLFPEIYGNWYVICPVRPFF